MADKKKTTTKTTKTTKTQTKRPTYKKSDSVKKAENKLSNWEKNAPDSYDSKYSVHIL